MNYQLIEQILKKNSGTEFSQEKKQNKFLKINNIIKHRSSTRKQNIINPNAVEYNQAININQFRKQLINVCNMRSVEDPVVLIIKKINYQNTFLKQQVKRLQQEVLALQQQKMSQKRIRQRKSVRMNSIKCLYKQKSMNMFDVVLSGTEIKDQSSAQSLKDKLSVKLQQQDHLKTQINEQQKNRQYTNQELIIQIKKLNQQLRLKNQQLIVIKNQFIQVQKKFNDFKDNLEAKMNENALLNKSQLEGSEKNSISTIKQVNSSQQLSMINKKNAEQSSYNAIMLQNKILKDLQIINQQQILLQKEQIQWLSSKCEQLQNKMLKLQNMKQQKAKLKKDRK